MDHPVRADRLSQSPFWIAALAAMLTLGAGPASAEGGGAISVSGTTITRDGRPWIPKGFTLVSFVAPQKQLKPAYLSARKSYGDAILDRARALGADVLRFQVSQPGLDPQSSIYDPKYKDEVIEAIHEAQHKGFAIIVSMQWEPPAGLEGQPQMPSDNTHRAWSQIVGAFGSDPGVMLEVFNEPGMWEENPGAWATWKSGMQSLIDQLRSAGAKNVLLIDGLRGAHYLQDAPALSDPLHKLVYAIHPYMDDRDHGPSDWTRDFGRFAANHPVLTTEWNATSTLQCRPDEPAITRDFIAYLKERKIGLVLWALDLPGTLFDGNNQPIGFKDFVCGKAGYGAANLSLQYFRDIGTQ
jgi:endoglucanase